MKYIKIILCSIRGLSELIGVGALFVFFLMCNKNGEPFFMEVWNKSVDNIGTFGTIVFIFIWCVVGYAYKHESDHDLN